MPEKRSVLSFRLHLKSLLALSSPCTLVRTPTWLSKWNLELNLPTARLWAVHKHSIFFRATCWH